LLKKLLRHPLQDLFMCCCFFKAAARLREKITRRWPRVCHVRLPELSMVEMAENPAALHSPHILPHTTFISNMMRYTDLSKISERKHCSYKFIYLSILLDLLAAKNIDAYLVMTNRIELPIQNIVQCLVVEEDSCCK